MKIYRLRSASIYDHLDTLRIYGGYRNTNSLKSRIRKEKNTKLAVVLHLYYPDMWPVFAERFSRLDPDSFDLFVSIRDKKSFDDIVKDYPKAYVLKTPNRGRDVLPFLKIMNVVKDAGYEYCLKLHSKKSPQHTGGNNWSTELLDKLLPSDPNVIKSILSVLQKHTTGMVGPSDNYLPLTTYYPDNHRYIVTALTRAFGKHIAQTIQDHKEQYGFFAGTMFWVRLDSILPIIKTNYPIYYFAPEKAQLDGTFSHGLERVFSLSSQVLEKDLYACNGFKLVKIAYTSSETQDLWDDAMRGANK